jgi:hypothetical protein
VKVVKLGAYDIMSILKSETEPILKTKAVHILGVFFSKYPMRFVFRTTFQAILILIINEI